ncbi:MAG: hypothetical protein MI756_11740 [Chromatiales bacterium]|nr:hypothetical protein [Chromatiales bacterium]
MKSGMKIMIIGLISLYSFVLHAAQNNWLSLESDGIHIHKLYGLTGGEYLTVNLFSVDANKEENAIQLFYKMMDKDVQRVAKVYENYHVQLTKIPKLAVITTMKRCADQTGKPILIHYQGFFVVDRQEMWYVRTELNDNLKLLIQYYREILDHVFAQMNVGRLESDK